MPEKVRPNVQQHVALRHVAPRHVILRRRTRETEVLVDLDLDGAAEGKARNELVKVRTGIGFLDHLLGALAFHAGWSLELLCVGDLEVDDHHSAEDCALLLGEALSRALARGGAPCRFGWAYAPLDESLARAVVDLSGRPSATVKLGLDGAKLGDLMGENVGHVIASLAAAARLTVHVDVIRSENTHHAAEAAFKALALALRMACAVVPERAVSGAEGGPSTKGLVEMEELDREGFESAARRVSSLLESGHAGGPGKGGRM